MSLNLISSVCDKISLTANIRANATEESSVHRKETPCHGNSGTTEKLKTVKIQAIVSFLSGPDRHILHSLDRY